MIITRALTHLRLEMNVAKAARLDALGEEYMFVLECYCRHLFGVAREGGAIDPLQRTLPPLASPLSARWRRCAWRQACGTMKSWFSNGRDRDGSSEPSFAGVAIQASVNTVTAAKSVRATSFGWWLRISTLDRGEPLHAGFNLHPHAGKVLRQALASGGKLCGDVSLRRLPDGAWSVQMATRTTVEARKAHGTLGVDAGIAAILSDSAGQQAGTLSGKLTGRLKRARDTRARKQKLNVCLEKKGLPPVDLVDGRTERLARAEIDGAVGGWVQALAARERVPLVVLEKLHVASMRAKSRDGNLLLRAAQLGHLGRALRARLDLAGIPWREVNPSCTSQQCRVCGFTLRQNRPVQARFSCLACGHEENADTHAAKVIAGRSGDSEINAAPWRLVRSILAERFMRRWGGRPPAGPGLRKALAQAGLSGPPGGDPWRRFLLEPAAGVVHPTLQTARSERSSLVGHTCP